MFQLMSFLKSLMELFLWTLTQTSIRNPPSVESKPVTVEKFEFHSFDHLVRKYQTYGRSWLMASLPIERKVQLLILLILKSNLKF